MTAARCVEVNPSNAVRTASVKLAGALEPLIAEKLEVLQSTSTGWRK